MNIFRLHVLFAFFSSAPVFAQQDASIDRNEDKFALCPVYTVSPSELSLQPQGHVKVKSDQAQIVSKQLAEFKGDVSIYSDRATIRAEEAKVSENGRKLQATGNVRYLDTDLSVTSDAISVDSINHSLNIENSQYQLNGQPGHGAAQQIQLDRARGLILSDVSFTTCPLDSPDWHIEASEISIEKGTAWGQAKSTRFYVGDVPIFYLPYFAFPVSNQRQTGLLFPKISSSSMTGFDYEQPFYWNIAPNYDFTISPRIMTRRGIQLKNEYRYLTEMSYGQINLEYLPDDREFANNTDRWFYRFYHQGKLTGNWFINADINGVSDDNYIIDLGSDFYNRADTHLYRSASMDYFSENLIMDFRVLDFVTLGESEDSYRALPEFRLAYFSELGSLFEFSLNSELAYFDSTALDTPEALRWHLAPTLTLPYRKVWGEFSAEASLLNTYYQQKNIEQTDLAEEVTRTLGQFRLFGALYFEREQQWLDKSSTMTLEPKLQYLYTSYEDQTMIGRYDTTPLLVDVDGLFRGQEFTGLDRISDNNQFTLGLTSRILDESDREQFVISVGQIFYLEENKVLAAVKDQNRSALAAELDWKLGSRWYTHTDVQIATKTDKVDRSSTSIEYRKDEKSLIQLSHRYIRQLSGEKIDQIGMLISWPITETLHWVGRTYRDRSLERSVESYFGLQYESCCWAVRLVGQRHLSNRVTADGVRTTEEFDSGISLQFIFKGMGSSKSSRSMLEEGMFGYRQPYSLN
ncbi:LPS-assembly protein LptD [Alteromonas sp. ASW11-130]|uniref:LPS-assembly protein LptD n=1 Tax=Alteromonas sp. ASW11-130 TaxID=3015775 RepID=UPI00224217B6|nr:LPS assembly protein LptD [Alteromonas sp. ASW11-130]MCW8090478.1 LPS assembly protein LptD [Alteromonas sp. ASW11-130]